MSDETVIIGGPSPDRREHLGKYVLEGTLGEGAMGVVYRARDPLLDRTVAIKTIRASGFPADTLAELHSRFAREARSAARLSHPGIVQIYDYGDADGVAFLVMEFVDGRSLKDVLVAGERLPVAEAVRVGADILDALEHAHGQGVVHRDIKPANVMLTHDGVAKLTDFGIARLEVEGLTITQAGQIIGTPGYMAPEQVQGHPATKSTDIYAAGVMIYELVTGERPFTGTTTSLLHRIVHESPIPPTVINVSAPAWLDGVLLKAMSKRPDERYATAGAFARALRDTGQEQGGRSAKGRLVAAGLSVAVLAAGSGAWLYRDALFGPAEPDPPVVDVQPAPSIPEGPSDSDAWAQAQATATIQAFEAYLQAFPEGENAIGARAAIQSLQDAAAADLAWSQAAVADTQEAYQAFLATHPEADRAADARQRIAELERAAAVQREQVAWDQAQAADTTDAYEGFLEAFPQSAEAPAARERIDVLRIRAAEERAWAEARNEDTLPAYQAFLADHPEAHQAADARQRIAELEQAAAVQREQVAWYQAQAADTTDAYEGFLEAFPQSVEAPAARDRIDVLRMRAAEEQAWAEARNEDTLPAYQAFLADHPEADQAADAQQRVAELEQAAWDQAQAADTADAYRGFIETFPDSRHTADANARIADLEQAAADLRAWQQTEAVDTMTAYRDYLAAFPEGRHSADAASRLQTLEDQAAEDLAWSTAETADTIATYRAFLASHPASRRTSLAEERIAALEEAEALERTQDAVIPPPDAPVDEASVPPQAAEPAPELGPQTVEAALDLSLQDRRAVQYGLNVLGFSAGMPDGVLGDNSRRAIEAFQRDRGETATGYLTQVQWWALRDAAATVPEPEGAEVLARPGPPGGPPPPPEAIDFGLVARLNGPWTDAAAQGCTPTLIFSLVNRSGSVRWQGAEGTQTATVTVEAAGDGIVRLGMAGVGTVDVRITPSGVAFRGQTYRRC